VQDFVVKICHEFLKKFDTSQRVPPAAFYSTCEPKSGTALVVTKVKVIHS
jgi:hypothetical protein